MKLSDQIKAKVAQLAERRKIDMQRMRDRGATNAAIARRFGVSPQRVIQILGARGGEK